MIKAFQVLAATLIGFVYVISDGFSIGIGILTSLLNESKRKAALITLAPLWDMTETWFVLIITSLLCILPATFHRIPWTLRTLFIILLAFIATRSFSLGLNSKLQSNSGSLSISISSIALALTQGVIISVLIRKATSNHLVGGFKLNGKFAGLMSLEIVMIYFRISYCWLLFQLQRSVRLVELFNVSNAVASIIAFLIRSFFLLSLLKVESNVFLAFLAWLIVLTIELNINFCSKSKHFYYSAANCLLILETCAFIPLSFWSTAKEMQFLLPLNQSFSFSFLLFAPLALASTLQGLFILRS